MCPKITVPKSGNPGNVDVKANTTNLVCGGECATFGYDMCEAEGTCVSHRQTCNGTCLG